MGCNHVQVKLLDIAVSVKVLCGEPESRAVENMLGVPCELFIIARFKLAELV
jgi:hypothetical protein